MIKYFAFALFLLIITLDVAYSFQLSFMRSAQHQSILGIAKEAFPRSQLLAFETTKSGKVTFLLPKPAQRRQILLSDTVKFSGLKQSAKKSFSALCPTFQFMSAASNNEPEMNHPTTIKAKISNFIRRIRRIVSFPIRKLRQIFGRFSSKDETVGHRSNAPAQPKQTATTSTDSSASQTDGSREIAAQFSAGKQKASEKSDILIDRLGVVVVPDRSPLAATDVDLSGKWDLIVTEEFKKEYDKYLEGLGQPFFVRSVALSIVGLTTEETIHSEQGRELFIRGRNIRGVWERTLLASEGVVRGSDGNPKHERTPIKTADDEPVEAEAWWEDDGRVHRSWLVGATNYGGGDFESKRYLERGLDGSDILVCESTFHPKDTAREKASVTWRFKRQESA